MRPSRALLLALLVVPGCAQGGDAGQDDAGAPPAAANPSAASPTEPASPATAASAPKAGTAPAPPRYRVTYGWAVPSNPARVTHTLAGPPLPYLAEIHAADHADYSRISFYFRGGFPSYELQYVAQVPAEGTGEPIPLPGNSFLRIQFSEARAHDEQGRSTVEKAPRPSLGFANLRGYGFGGDFEGYVSYGLGIQVAPGSDQVLPIRVGELRRPDGFHVVAVDVRHG